MPSICMSQESYMHVYVQFVCLQMQMLLPSVLCMVCVLLDVWQGTHMYKLCVTIQPN